MSIQAKHLQAKDLAIKAEVSPMDHNGDHAEEQSADQDTSYRMLHVSLAHITAMKSAKEAAAESDAGTALFLSANRGAVYARLYPLLDLLTVRREVWG